MASISMKHEKNMSFFQFLNWIGRSISIFIKFGSCFLFILIAYYQIQKYAMNDDLTIFSVKYFKGIGWHKFPAITICFKGDSWTVSETLFNLTSIQSKLNLSVLDYGNILLGIKDLDDWKKITEFDYEKNTINIKDFLKKFKIKDSYEKEYSWYYNETQKEPKFEIEVDHPLDWNRESNHIKESDPLIPVYLDPYLKCFTHHPDLDDEATVQSITFYFYISKLVSLLDMRIVLFVHHKDQLIRNMRYIYKVKNFAKIKQMNSNNQLVVNVNYVRIVKNRNDAELKCNDTLHFDDQKWMQQIVRNVSCIPPYWKSIYGNNKTTICSSKDKLNLARHYLPYNNIYGVNEMMKKYSPPCYRMQVTANVNRDWYKKKDLFKIKFHYR